MMKTTQIGFVDAKSMYVVRQWELEDLISELQRKLAKQINAVRNAQRATTNELDRKYHEGYADALGDVIKFLEDLRREDHDS